MPVVHPGIDGRGERIGGVEQKDFGQDDEGAPERAEDGAAGQDFTGEDVETEVASGPKMGDAVESDAVQI
jgi:hypothetical protein